MTPALRIATRQSPLALWQANHVKDGLRRRHPGLAVELVGVTARGDKLLDAPLAKVGGKGLFVKELQAAMLEGRADLAVHSMKDLPARSPAGLALGAICARADPSDAFVSNRHASVAALPAGAVVGTSSLRRECQLRQRRPDLQVRFLRGNVNTRLRKLDAGDYDAILLATAGLQRLGLAGRIRHKLPLGESLPAAGQGAVGVELRAADDLTLKMLQPLRHEATARCVRAERALTTRLQGDCQTPIACLAQYHGPGRLWLRGLVGRADGAIVLRAEARGSHHAPEALGAAVADDLLAQGAGELLARTVDR